MAEGFELTDYFAIYGPFALLFVSLFYWTLRTSKEREETLRNESREREEILRKEVAQLRAESEERSRRHYEVLSEFAKKYDIVIEKLDELKSQLARKE